MHVAVNTLPAPTRSWFGRAPEPAPRDERYIRRLLEAARGVQRDTRFMVFTHSANENAYPQWLRVAVQDEGAETQDVRGAQPAVQSAIRRAKVECVLSPIDAPLPNCPVPQVLYITEVHEEFQGQRESGKRPPRGLKALQKNCQEAAGILVPPLRPRRLSGAARQDDHRPARRRPRVRNRPAKRRRKAFCVDRLRREHGGSP